MSTKMTLADYEIRTGKDGKRGIYLRAYNVRMATFRAGSASLQKLLAATLKRASREPKAERLARIGGGKIDLMLAATSSKTRKFNPNGAR